MKTDYLINMLARGDVRPQPFPTARAAIQVAFGLLVTFGLMAAFLGMRDNLIEVLALPAFWMKLTFVITLAFIGLIATRRLSLPGVKVGNVPAMLAVPIIGIWSIAAVSLLTAASESRAALFWGDTWKVCSLLIAGLSTPIFFAILHVMRGLAPTHLRIAGASAGFTAGAAAAVVYCLHCPELTAPFVAFWYVLGISIPTVTGVLIGPRILRW
jgi:hypothetical protein